MSNGPKCTIHPYVVRPRENDPEGHGIFGLGHGLEVALLVSRQGLARAVMRDEIEALGIDPSVAYLRALDRLTLAYLNRHLPWTMMPGPSGRPTMVFHHRYLAASCMLLPELYDHASFQLREERLRIAVPSRDRMIILRADDCEDPVRLAAFLRAVGRPGVLPDLTTNLFILDPGGISEQRTRPPCVSATAIEIEIDDDSEGERSESRTAA